MLYSENLSNYLILSKNGGGELFLPYLRNAQKKHIRNPGKFWLQTGSFSEENYVNRVEMTKAPEKKFISTISEDDQQTSKQIARSDKNNNFLT